MTTAGNTGASQEEHRLPAPTTGQGISLYVHVPFCQTKCPYCDFNTYQGIESLFYPYLEALAAEVGLWGKALGHPPVNTVFFGGGTPSYLPEGSIIRLMDRIREAFPVDEDAEITIEANPGDLSESLCHNLLAAGINRISFGVQSLDDGMLKMLGRRHSAQQAADAFATATLCGFGNANLDLIYGLPGQTMEQWCSSVEGVVSLGPSHVSLYCLTLESGTPMQVWVRDGELPEPDPDLAADMYELAREVLAEAGYHHYEISNWALPGQESRHNLAYWLNRPYLGVGPGAHSRLGSHRFWTVNSPRAYIDGARRWQESGAFPGAAQLDSPEGEAFLKHIPTVGGSEHIDATLRYAETMFLGLRLLDGMDLEEASIGAGADLARRYESDIGDLIDLGLLEAGDSNLRLTPKAYLIANQVFTRFLE